MLIANYTSLKFVDGSGSITVATTSPETILGDVAICVNPDDERYKHFIGKEVIVPIINRKIPIIADEYVDAEFGTGALKITPAHDKNDNMLGRKHNLKALIHWMLKESSLLKN
jgi:valyl-tRNA synthetase